MPKKSTFKNTRKKIGTVKSGDSVGIDGLRNRLIAELKAPLLLKQRVAKIAGNLRKAGGL